MDGNIKSRIVHKILDKGNTKIHYYVSGENNTETIIFIHSAFGDHQNFDYQVDFFSLKFRVVTIDMLGHGLSVVGKSKNKISSTPDHLAEILNLENIEQTHIVGVSLGALLAQCFALKYPQYVLSLTALGGYNIHKEQKEVVKSQRREMIKWLFKILFSMDAFRKYIATKSVLNTVEQALFYESTKHFTRMSFSVMSDLDQLIKNCPKIHTKYPLLIMCGEKDVELSKKLAIQWHEEEFDSEICIIEKAGHCANMDNSFVFNKILNEFITKTIVALQDIKKIL